MTATTVPYHLRPNKAIEREIFLDLLGALKPVIPLSMYSYVGFGGPFLEDFRLVRKRIGVQSLVCVERDSDTHARQRFNCTMRELRCVEGDFEDVRSELNLDGCQSIVWLDYSDGRNLRGKIQAFVDLLTMCREESIIKLTLNAEVPRVERDTSSRLDKARKKLGEYFPEDITEADMRGPQEFSRVLLRALRIALSKNRRGSGLEFRGLCSFVYADGVPMVTVTGVLLEKGKVASFLERTNLRTWEYYNEVWDSPRFIEVPVLSLVEQRELAVLDPAQALASFSLPQGRLVKDVVESYRAYARLYPHFARVEV